MSTVVHASDAAQCASRSGEIHKLAQRLQHCVHRVESAAARLSQLELHNWQSPAGRAYQTTLSHHQSVLRRTVATLQDAVAAVQGHGQAAAQPGRAL
ncbi:hypothetical protein [Arthrobacter sp. M4]|uniref:hypothetical protein n=1 Tax=Arthrobacter sp. M4 TaxID=218160 RepID=UPI001CDCB0A2|nr:hypothetical protein [Arthrobacter sp. M4]MCA4135667.1 hypothetical protein [Arthrobacter sp. M4]